MAIKDVLVMLIAVSLVSALVFGKSLMRLARIRRLVKLVTASQQITNQLFVNNPDMMIHLLFR